jgi:hypothetical protein
LGERTSSGLNNTITFPYIAKNGVEILAPMQTPSELSHISKLPTTGLIQIYMQ